MGRDKEVDTGLAPGLLVVDLDSCSLNLVDTCSVLAHLCNSGGKQL